MAKKDKSLNVENIKKDVIASVMNRLRDQQQSSSREREDESAAFKTNQALLNQIKSELQQVRNSLQKNQRLFQASQSTKQYVSPQTRLPVAVKQQVTGVAGRRVVSGLETIMRKGRVVSASARALKEAGVPKFARRSIIEAGAQGIAGRAVVGGVGRAVLGNVGRAALANPFVLGAGAAASLFLPSDLKGIVGGVVKGFLTGIGFNETLVSIVTSPFSILSDIADKAKEIISYLFDWFNKPKTPSGNPPGQPPGTPGQPPGTPAGSGQPPEGGQPPGSGQPQQTKADYDNAKKRLLDRKKDLDDKIATHERIINENKDFPEAATQEQKNEYKQEVGKLVELRDQVNNQLKETLPSKPDWTVEKNKLDNLSSRIEQQSNKVREIFKRMGQPTSSPEGKPPTEPTPTPSLEGKDKPADGGKPGGEPVPASPEGKPAGGGDSGGEPVPASPEGKPAGGGDSGGEPVPASPEGMPSGSVKPGGEPVPASSEGKPAGGGDSGGEPVPASLEGMPPGGGDSGGEPVPTSPEGMPMPSGSVKPGGEPVDAAGSFPTLASNSQQPLQSVSTAVPYEPSSGMDINQRSQNIIQARYTPRTQDVQTNVINNSRNIPSSLTSEEVHHIPSPTASRSDLDASIVFDAVA